MDGCGCVNGLVGLWLHGLGVHECDIAVSVGIGVCGCSWTDGFFVFIDGCIHRCSCNGSVHMCMHACVRAYMCVYVCVCMEGGGGQVWAVCCCGGGGGG